MDRGLPVSFPAARIVLFEGYSTKSAVAGPMGRAADAARVIEVRVADAEELIVFEEKRPLLGKPRFERGEIDLRGIGFDLAEVGIDCRLE